MIIDLDSVPSLDPNSFDYLEGETVEYLEDEITGIEKAIASAKATKAKWIKLLDLASRAHAAKRRSTRKSRIEIVENGVSLKEFINPNSTGLELKISIFRSTASGKVQQYTKSYSSLLSTLKIKQKGLQDLKQEVADTKTGEGRAAEAGYKAGAARAEESGAKTKNIFMYVIFGVVVLVAIIFIIRLLKN